MAFSCDDAPGNAGSSPAVGQHTKKGVAVISPVAVPDVALDAIDRGIQRAIDKMPTAWTKARSHTAYIVRFVEPETRNQDGSPALLVNGTIQASGETKGYCTRGDCEATFYKCGEVYLRLPHQAPNWAYLDVLEGSAQAEAEHEEEGEAVIAREAPPSEFCRWAWPNPDVHMHRP